MCLGHKVRYEHGESWTLLTIITRALPKLIRDIRHVIVLPYPFLILDEVEVTLLHFFKHYEARDGLVLDKRVHVIQGSLHTDFRVAALEVDVP